MQLRFVPIFEAMTGTVTAGLALLSGLALWTELGEHGWTEQTAALALGACFCAALALAHLRVVVRHTVIVVLGRDLELRWPLRRPAIRVRAPKCLRLRAETRFTPWSGPRSEAQLVLEHSEGGAIIVPLMRRWHPDERFTSTLATLSQALDVPVDVDARPDHLGRNLDLRRPSEIGPGLLRQAIEWRATNDPEFPYQYQSGGHLWRLRVNDFPEHPTVYSLVVEDFALDVSELPSCWRLPSR